MPSRRALVAALGMGAAGVAVSPIRAMGSNGPVAHPPPWWLLQPLSEGMTLRHGWVLQSLEPIRDGSTVLTLNHGTESLRIHICLHDGAPRGFAPTALFDLIVIDHGQGVRTVPIDLASNLRLLQRVIGDNELKRIRPEELSGISRFMTHPDRVSIFGASHIK